MTSDSRSSSIAPLSVGNVVSVAFQLYRENAKQYLKIALAAIGWLSLPFAILIGLILIIALMVGIAGQSFLTLGMIVLAGVATLVLMVFCLAKYLTNSALISRLAFGQLSNQQMDELESRRFVNSRKWGFLLTQILVGLATFCVFLLSYLILAILVGIGFATISRIERSQAFGTVAILGLIAIVLVAVTIATMLWFSARLLGAEVPLAVESSTSASQSISRFWRLTKGNAWRVILILLLASAVTLPVFVLGQVSQSVLQQIVDVLPADSAYLSGLLEALVVLMSLVISIVLNLLVLPFWQVIKAVLYYDLRNRREGLDLTLRNR